MTIFRGKLAKKWRRTVKGAQCRLLWALRLGKAEMTGIIGYFKEGYGNLMRKEKNLSHFKVKKWS